MPSASQSAVVDFDLEICSKGPFTYLSAQGGVYCSYVQGLSLPQGLEAAAALVKAVCTLFEKAERPLLLDRRSPAALLVRACLVDLGLLAEKGMSGKREEEALCFPITSQIRLLFSSSSDRRMCVENVEGFVPSIVVGTNYWLRAKTGGSQTQVDVLYEIFKAFCTNVRVIKFWFRVSQSFF